MSRRDDSSPRPLPRRWREVFAWWKVVLSGMLVALLWFGIVYFELPFWLWF